MKMIVVKYCASSVINEAIKINSNFFKKTFCNTKNTKFILSFLFFSLFTISSQKNWAYPDSLVYYTTDVKMHFKKQIKCIFKIKAFEMHF